MPITDLPATPTALPDGGVRSLMRDLGSEDEYGTPPWPWTGRLHLEDAATGRSADLWLSEGTVYAAHMAGYVPPIALRLRSAGCLDDYAYAEMAALESTEVGPEAIERGLAPTQTVEEIHREVMLATVSHLYEWEFATWAWSEDEATGDYVTTGVPLVLVASAVDERIGQWRAVTRAHPHVVQPTAVPQPGPSWAEKAGAETSAELATLLSYVDGYATIAQIASACGFTRFEAARLLSQAAAEGVLVFTLAPPPLAPAVAFPVQDIPVVPTPIPVPAAEAAVYLPAPDATGGNDVRAMLAATQARIQEAQAVLADAAAQVAAALFVLDSGVSLPGQEYSGEPGMPEAHGGFPYGE